MGAEGQLVTDRRDVQLGGKGRGGRKTGRRERRGKSGKMMGGGAPMGRGRKIKAD